VLSKTKIPVTELRVGMYVAELDRPWIGTPFELQGFYITSPDQIAELGRWCKTVFIDVERDFQRDYVPTLPPRGQRVRGSTVYPETATVEKEAPVAKKTYYEYQEVVQQTMDALLTDRSVDTKRLTGMVASISQSVQRNPDAMLMLVKLKQKGEYEVRRAIDTSVLMITFGRFLQLSPERLDLLGIAGMMLDVGKVKLPDALLRNKGLLSPEQYQEVKLHVLHSIEIIRATPGLPQGIAEIAWLHHERQDGSGYPRGLRGPEISLEGSISAIVDTFSALTSERPYAPQYAPSDALNQLYKMRGTLYHGALVEQFIQCIGIYPVGSVVELNTGEIGIVIAQNLVRRLQPRVMVILDAGHQPVQPQVLLDLVKEPRATANQPYRIRRTLDPSTLPMDPREFFL